MSTVAQVYGSGLNNKEFTCGCEFEIESIAGHGNLQSDTRFIVDNDHSLRNNGYEYKTRPHPYEVTLGLFRLLHEQIKIDKKHDPFSERTSIHVHVNVGDMEMKSLHQMVLVYALLEPVFFEFAGEARKNSIFCVPLNYTYLPAKYNLPIDKLVEKWHKYTAFNLLPIKELGTVEFRHLGGTNDEARFKIWLTALRDLRKGIIDNPELDILAEIEKGITPAELATKFIPSIAQYVPWSVVNNICADTMLDVKLASGGIK